jgi:hypothetical protein
MIQPTIVNIQWTFANIPFGERTPFKVPVEMINPKINPKSSALSNYISMTADPVVITIKSL